jgi:hypothetical protein
MIPILLHAEWSSQKPTLNDWQATALHDAPAEHQQETAATCIWCPTLHAIMTQPPLEQRAIIDNQHG